VTVLDIDEYGNISILSEMVHSSWISDGTHTDISILSEMLDILYILFFQNVSKSLLSEMLYDGYGLDVVLYCVVYVAWHI